MLFYCHPHVTMVKPLDNLQMAIKQLKAKQNKLGFSNTVQYVEFYVTIITPVTIQHLIPSGLQTKSLYLNPRLTYLEETTSSLNL